MAWVITKFLIHTRLQPGDRQPRRKENRFNGFVCRGTETVETVSCDLRALITRLKPGGNEKQAVVESSQMSKLKSLL